jgi:hypothetical protein
MRLVLRAARQSTQRLLNKRAIKNTFAKSKGKLMNNLKKFLMVIVLTLMLAGTSLADCPAAVPGEMNTPPCTSGQQLTDDSADQTTTARTISSEAQIVVLETLITALENLLTVY